MPEISVITVNLNNRDGLKNTLESVISQTSKDFEYIVIDGGSNDGSDEILKAFKGSFKYWISEPDHGIYNAMNKGISQATGEYLLMLNSGDTLNNSKVLQNVRKLNLNQDLLYGDTLWIENKNAYITKYPDELQFSYFLKQSLGHQSTFIRRSLHSKLGMYDENYRIVSDWIFFTKAICKFNVSHKHIPFVISNCIRDGISCDPINQELINEERRSFIEAEFPHFINDYKDMECILQKLKEYDSEFLTKNIYRLKKFADKILKR